MLEIELEVNSKNKMGELHDFCDTIKVENPLRVYVPTGFRPYGLNTDFKPIMDGDIISSSAYLFEIFDRNGSVIFKTTDITQGWNGKVNGTGKLCSLGVYVWKVSVKEKKTKKTHDFMGNITLIR